MQITPEIRITKIGSIPKGIDGSDEYVTLTRLDDDLDCNLAHDWLLEQVYRESFAPGGYFCTSVATLPIPNRGNEVIGIIHHRYDV